MELKEYQEEIELIRDQNDTEFEIYPMAVEIIQPTLKNLSKRYVFARRKSAKGQIYYGLSSFPDVAILDKKYKNISNSTIDKELWIQLKGCLEVKSLGKKLITKSQVEEVITKKPDILEPEIGQLLGEILWYKKVLYTNGIEWRCLRVNEYSDDLIKKVIDTFKMRIDFENKNPETEFNWWTSFKELDLEIVDECLTENCMDDWKGFITKINQIKWE